MTYRRAVSPRQFNRRRPRRKIALLLDRSPSAGAALARIGCDGESAIAAANAASRLGCPLDRAKNWPTPFRRRGTNDGSKFAAGLSRHAERSTIASVNVEAVGMRCGLLLRDRPESKARRARAAFYQHPSKLFDHYANPDYTGLYFPLRLLLDERALRVGSNAACHGRPRGFRGDLLIRAQWRKRFAGRRRGELAGFEPAFINCCAII